MINLEYNLDDTEFVIVVNCSNKSSKNIFNSLTDWASLNSPLILFSNLSLSISTLSFVSLMTLAISGILSLNTFTSFTKAITEVSFVSRGSTRFVPMLSIELISLSNLWANLTEKPDLDIMSSKINR